MGTSGGRVSEGNEFVLPGLGPIGKDDGGINGSGNAGAALGAAGIVEPGSVNVGAVFLGVVDGISSKGSAGAGTGLAAGTGFLGLSGFESFVAERFSFSLGNTSGGKPPGPEIIGALIGSAPTRGGSFFFDGCTGEVTESLVPIGRIVSTIGIGCGIEAFGGLAPPTFTSDIAGAVGTMELLGLTGAVEGAVVEAVDFGIVSHLGGG